MKNSKNRSPALNLKLRLPIRRFNHKKNKLLYKNKNKKKSYINNKRLYLLNQFSYRSSFSIKVWWYIDEKY